jgi:hypothetical protein
MAPIPAGMVRREFPYRKPTVSERNGSKQPHTTLIEECDEPSVIPKADHLSHSFPNLSSTLDEESDEPSVIPKADRLSQKSLIPNSEAIAESN